MGQGVDAVGLGGGGLRFTRRVRVARRVLERGSKAGARSITFPHGSLRGASLRITRSQPVLLPALRAVRLRWRKTTSMKIGNQEEENQRKSQTPDRPLNRGHRKVADTHYIPAIWNRPSTQATIATSLPPNSFSRNDL
jgi:hypothetical protein